MPKTVTNTAVICLVAVLIASASSKTVSMERFGKDPSLPLMILLHGVGGPSPFYNEQAEFFARHGFRVVLPHYFEAGHGVIASDANYESWTAAVRKTIDDSRAETHSPVVVVGFSLGASIALALGSEGQGPDAIAEVSGSLPDRYFRDLKGMPPLLILHGERDAQIPVNNALQLEQLCSDAQFRCDIHVYPAEGHGFTPAAGRDADERILRFLSQILQAENSPR